MGTTQPSPAHCGHFCRMAAATIACFFASSFILPLACRVPREQREHHERSVCQHESSMRLLIVPHVALIECLSTCEVVPVMLVCSECTHGYMHKHEVEQRQVWWWRQNLVAATRAARPRNNERQHTEHSNNTTRNAASTPRPRHTAAARAAGTSTSNTIRRLQQRKSNGQHITTAVAEERTISSLAAPRSASSWPSMMSACVLSIPPSSCEPQGNGIALAMKAVETHRATALHRHNEGSGHTRRR